MMTASRKLQSYNSNVKRRRIETRKIMISFFVNYITVEEHFIIVLAADSLLMVGL